MAQAHQASKADDPKSPNGPSGPMSYCCACKARITTVIAPIVLNFKQLTQELVEGVQVACRPCTSKSLDHASVAGRKQGKARNARQGKEAW